MASGFGGMTEDDVGKSPVQILNEHDSKVKKWVKTLDGPSVVKNLKVATSHPYYDKFISQFSKKNFGAGGRDDLVEFDSWLKKVEISEKRNTTPSPPSVPTPEESPSKDTPPPTVRGKGKGSVPGEPVPKTRDESSTSKVPDDALPKLTPEQQKAYQTYWKKFSSQNLGSSEEKAPRPAIVRRSTSVMSDGEGDAAVTADEKFALLKAFLLDPTSMSDITIESHYVEKAKEEDKSKWREVSLSTLRKEFTSPAEQRFLQEKIVNAQPGRQHPQSDDPEMRLYWVFREGSAASSTTKEVGTALRGKGAVPANKAARTSVADSLLGRAADFGRKGAPSTDVGSKGKTGKAGGKTRNPTKKAAPFESYAKLLEEKEPLLEAQLQLSKCKLPIPSLTATCDVWRSGLDRSKAAEKRKADKAAAKAKGAPAPKRSKVKQEAPATPAAPAAEADAEWPEDWPEDFEDENEIDGEELQEDQEWE
eukprot:s132_g22.t1